METYFEDHCKSCDSVTEREATVFNGLGQWVCDDCGNVTTWNTLDVLRLSL